MHANRTRVLLGLAALAVAGALGVNPASQPEADATPVAADAATYAQCGRVFPDPHAYWPAPTQVPGQSPWAKGNAACRAVDFLGWDETIGGLQFLESLFPGYVEVYDLADPNGRFASSLDPASGEGMTAGLPTEGLTRERVPMYVVRVTDEASTAVPIDERKLFAYTLSIHGIERAGIEGGIRAIEDLATWAACEADPAAAATCALNGPFPHPIMEPLGAESITAGDALRRSQVWFVLSNPDGWRRGDKQSGGFFYQRYNGNGMDMNRDWPSKGFTFRPYTPWSEPETRAVGKVLRAIDTKWTGAIDLHGQLIDRAFSFTLIGGAERPFDKDRRVLQFVKGAWADAETRLAWSPIIKPNDAPPACLAPSTTPAPSDDPDCDPSPRIYGVQWGTIWDTIAYTTTGAVGDWMDSEIGLDADAIDNEMSLSHLSNCGIGTCFLTDFEQMHVDGNKSLVYAMIHYSLLPEDTGFRYEGDAAWLDHGARVRNAGSGAPAAGSGLPVQAPFSADLVVTPTAPAIHEFEVLGKRDGVENGGFRVVATSANLAAVTPLSFLEFAVDRYRAPEEDPDAPEEGWTEVSSYFNQSPTYFQAGAQVDVNLATPGRYRVRVEGPAAGAVHIDGTFTKGPSWPDPGQVPYDVSNLDFFSELAPFAPPGALVPASLDGVLSGSVGLSRYDSLVIADQAFLPGYSTDAPPRTAAQAPITTTMAMGQPGLGSRAAGTSTFTEFDVEAGHGALLAHLDAPTVTDPDLFLQRRLDDGSWSEDLATGENATANAEDLEFLDPPAGHYRIEAHNYAGTPGDATLTVTFELPAAGPAVAPGTYDAADESALLARLRAFVEGGGNLVLTDDGLRVVERMGLVPAGSVGFESVYAGFAEFSVDGGTTETYTDPLAASVDQPGAAEGPGHRHQLSEPVPTGWAIQDEDGADLNTMPQWGVDPAAWEKAGGRVVGMANGAVTLGELPLGEGQIRIIGSLLPMPTELYDHPFGLGSYGVTYSGYEVFRNALDASTPSPAPAAPPGGGGALPATGGDMTPLVALLGGGVIVMWLFVRRIRAGLGSRDDGRSGVARA